MTETIIQLNGRGNCPNCANPEATTWEDYVICHRCGSAYKENPVLITSDIETNPPVANPPEGAKYRRLTIIIERIPVDYGMVIDEMSESVGDDTCWFCQENTCTGFDMLCDDCRTSMRHAETDREAAQQSVTEEPQERECANCDLFTAGADGLCSVCRDAPEIVHPDFNGHIGQILTDGATSVHVIGSPNMSEATKNAFLEIARAAQAEAHDDNDDGDEFWIDDLDDEIDECSDCGMPIEDCICDGE